MIDDTTLGSWTKSLETNYTHLSKHKDVFYHEFQIIFQWVKSDYQNNLMIGK